MQPASNPNSNSSSNPLYGPTFFQTSEGNPAQNTPAQPPVPGFSPYFIPFSGNPNAAIGNPHSSLPGNPASISPYLGQQALDLVGHPYNYPPTSLDGRATPLGEQHPPIFFPSPSFLVS